MQSSASVDLTQRKRTPCRINCSPTGKPIFISITASPDGSAIPRHTVCLWYTVVYDTNLEPVFSTSVLCVVTCEGLIKFCSCHVGVNLKSDIKHSSKAMTQWSWTSPM